MTEPAHLDPPVIDDRDSDVIRLGGRSAPRKRAFTVLKWCVVIVLMTAGLTFGGFNAWFLYDYFSDPKVEAKAFRSEDWKKLSDPWSKAGRLTRHFMAEDLLAKNDLKGMTRGGILDLLGPSDSRAMFARDTVPYVFSYRLAPRPIIDDCWLVIEFDRNDVVASASIVGK